MLVINPAPGYHYILPDLLNFQATNIVAIQPAPNYSALWYWHAHCTWHNLARVVNKSVTSGCQICDLLIESPRH